MDIATVKAYLRIDDDEEDSLIGLMMEAAEECITEAVGAFDETKSRARMLYLAAVQDMYDNRQLVATGASSYGVSQNFRHMTNSLIMQLQIEELEESEADGGV